MGGAAAATRRSSNNLALRRGGFRIRCASAAFLWKNLHAHACNAFADHPEFICRFFAEIDLYLPISDAAICDAHDDGFVIREMSYSDARADRQRVMGGS